MNKLEELGNMATSIAERKRAIGMLEEYSRIGFYARYGNKGEVDENLPLRDLAAKKAAELRTKMLSIT